ncbi:MAG: alpha-amylase family glycosyl hydrolase [Verrucomicrobiota bacterium JB023]|nr:alpha-amylase family glycosyl hydrolase [Verrucomicrobiota bacterium JB023]
MGDFHQSGNITTLHQLRQRPLEDLEAELTHISQTRPMALVLPSLYSELQGPALSKIVAELAHVNYLDQIVVGLDQANEEEYRHALRFFENLPQQPKVLWNDGPRLRDIDARLQSLGLAPDQPGKGRNVWYMFGYILAMGRAEAIALHDCDIVTYERGLLARLIYPVANPAFSYKFCKGYYARIANQSLNGRVCRLLVTPLLRALQKVCGPNDYLSYLDGFRYPLAGEFSLQREVLEDIKIPSDWGLEMGVLSEMHRNYAPRNICQVDIADVYDHKHQDLSLEDRNRGLSKMSVDISKSLFRKMATQGQVFSQERIRTIKATYYRIALDLNQSYHDDALINGLKYNRHIEGLAVENFAQNIMVAGNDFLEKSMETPFMPSWRRVHSAYPEVFEELKKAVELDMRDFSTPTPISISRSPNPEAVQIHQRLTSLVSEIYQDQDASALTDQICEAAGLGHDVTPSPANINKWSENDVFLITYGDSIIREGESPLATLQSFISLHLADTVSGVHILPFCPFTSDDGFSVVDYKMVNPQLGDWKDIQAISSEKTFMIDVVLNHCSASSVWFQNFLNNKSPGADYFITEDPAADLSEVVRPRATPLLREVETSDGTKHVWCTFSHDQVDLNFANPEVLLEFVRILREYVQHGASYFRLDAVAYLWKEIGTPCIHHEKTHTVIKLLRLILEKMEPAAVLVTETNVPNEENLTYFGNNNEAHLIYNFSLPPLLLHALLSGQSRYLKQWMMSMPPARPGRAYFNFIASHDGIGVRPAEGVLDDAELEGMLETLLKFGGQISTRSIAGTEKPYEMNISLFDALQGTLKGTKDDFQEARFLCAHTILLALEGIPAFYIHSILATPNDQKLFAETGRKRSINRHRWQADELEVALSSETSHARVLSALKYLIEIRRRQPAFHPNATQYTLHYGEALFAFWRESLDRTQNIFAIHNVTCEEQEVPLVELNLTRIEDWRDLITNTPLVPGQTTWKLGPYESLWLTNA